MCLDDDEEGEVDNSDGSNGNSSERGEVVEGKEMILAGSMW